MSLSFHEWLASKYYLAASEKPFLRKRRIRVGPLVMTQSWMFAAGALIGRAKRDQLPSLWGAFKTDSDVGISAEEVREILVESASVLTQLCELHEPRNFLDLAVRWGFPELNHAQAVSAYMQDLSTKITEQKALEVLQNAVIQSLGLGVTHPELVERIADGQDRSIEERTNEMLVELFMFASENRPNLIEPLGLRLQ